MTRQDKTRQDKTRQDKTRQDKTRQPIVRNSNRKILIVTLFAPIGNYGNILQHYALKESVSSFGYEVDSLECPIKELSYLRRIVKYASRNIKRAIKLILAAIGVKKYRDKLINKLASKGKKRLRATKSQDTQRSALFKKFYAEEIGNLIPSTYREALTSPSSRWDEYRCVITGSDQVWNSSMGETPEALKYYYLEFVDRSKRVNYAPSFGVSRLGLFERHIHKKGIQGFDKLSCREEEGCRLIHELTGRNAELVLDPTLLLTAEDWRKIARKPDYDIPEHYAFCYFWNNDNDEYMQAVHEVSGGIDVLYALNPALESYSKTGPREFLWLIDHADYVFSESFHGTAFSINFGKEFVSFGLESLTFSRIHSILNKLGLMDRIYDPKSKNSYAPINYEAVNIRLEALRKSSLEYLTSCLRE